MTIDEINNKIFDVSIIQKGKEGDTLCFRVTNDILGEFIISNCHYNTDPTIFPNAKNHLNGETILKLSEEIMHNLRTPGTGTNFTFDANSKFPEGEYKNRGNIS